jgi:hypothetical protein
MDEMRNAYNILTRKYERKTKLRCKMWNNIKIKIMT